MTDEEYQKFKKEFEENKSIPIDKKEEKPIEPKLEPKLEPKIEPKTDVQPEMGIQSPEFAKLQANPLKDYESNDDYDIEVINDYDGSIDETYLNNKDPNWHYRYLYMKPENLSLKTSNLLSRGAYQLVPRNHCIKVLELKEKQLTGEGFYRVGDLVLGYCPKKIYEDKLALKNKMANAPMEEVERLLDKGDPNSKELSGVGHVNQKGIQTAKDLGMKS